MIVLGLETSQDQLRIGIVEENSVLAEENQPAKGILAEIILDSLDQALRKAGLRLADLSGLAFSQGPGSFTGLRVGLATLKGLAWGPKIPLLAVPTFEVIASQFENKNTEVAVLSQARENLFLAGIYTLSESLSDLQGELFVGDEDRLNEKSLPKRRF